MTDADLPELFHRADEEAILWKGRFLRLFRLQIVLLYLGAITGTASRYGATNLMTLLSLLCFLIVAGLRLFQRFSPTADRWPAARWVAERTKSLAWLYAVGAEPFILESGTPEEARQRLGADLTSVFDGWPWGVSAPQIEEQITPTMESLRSSSFEVRRSTYLSDRVDEQANWYEAKAHAEALRGKRWDLAFVAVSVAAIVGGVLQLTDLMEFDLLRLAGFAAALIVSWTGLNRYRRQAKTYRSAARDLRLLAREAASASEPSGWSGFVLRIEATIRREGAGWFEARN